MNYSLSLTYNLYNSLLAYMGTQEGYTSSLMNDPVTATKSFVKAHFNGELIPGDGIILFPTEEARTWFLMVI